MSFIVNRGQSIVPGQRARPQTAVGKRGRHIASRASLNSMTETGFVTLLDA